MCEILAPKEIAMRRLLIFTLPAAWALSLLVLGEFPLTRTGGTVLAASVFAQYPQWATADGPGATTQMHSQKAARSGNPTAGLSDLVSLADSLQPLQNRFNQLGDGPQFIAVLSPT
jgi:hypothetical protein